MRRTIFGTLVPSDEPESDNEKAMMDILHYAKNVGIETVDTPIDIQFVARLLKAYDDKLGHIKRICASKIVNEELLKSEKDLNRIIVIPNNITRKELHKAIFGVNPPELDSPYCSCARGKDGCEKCKHKDDLNCDVNWWNAPYKKEETNEH